jgi:hypothetical protein
LFDKPHRDAKFLRGSQECDGVLREAGASVAGAGYQEGRADTFVQTHAVGDFTDICADFFAKIGHTDLDVSRNSLREAFRLLAKEGLLRHEPNRGVFVATPSMASIIDIYRIRKIIECQALAKAYPKHPAVARMRGAVESARKASEK